MAMALLMGLSVFVGIKLSECEFTQLGSSSNEPNNTAVSVFLSRVSLGISMYSR
jgi:hypothetical protein